MTYFTRYKAVFDAVKAAVETKDSIKTVILGERFTVGALPKAIINAEPSPLGQAAMGEFTETRVRGSIVLVILEYEPEDWFNDIIAVMGDCVDAILADRSLDGVVFDCIPTGFAPGEIKFKEKTFYGGVVRWEAILHYG
ncbi:MAG: hypothetical protein IAX21_07275 [Candidatus Bathyarchaeota archaeon]|nr:MAG: hypothetical protein IAX21_07275 [Candidatus Bathyarchaeota archaeon]